MSGAVKGVKKIFKVAAPIAIGAGLSLATGGTASAAMLAGAKAGAGSLLSGAMGGSDGGDARSMIEAGTGRVAAIPQSVSRSPGMTDMSAGDTSEGGLLNWLENNPEATKVIAGAAGGAAKSFSEGRRFDELLEHRRRQNELDRTFTGAFYGRTANPLIQRPV